MSQKNNIELRPYKNIHQGERVFMIGCGPSLSQTNLDLIADQWSFSMNRIAMIYGDTRWRPSYYLYCSTNVNDKKWGKVWIESIRQAINAPGTKSFIWDKFGTQITQPGLLAFPIVWIRCMTERRLDPPENTFPVDAVARLDKSGTTMNPALQLCVYMGFKQIILVGADVNYKSTDCKEGSSDPNHFDPTYRASIGDGDRDNAMVRKAHQAAYDVMRKHGVEVLNATVDTMLDVYPLVPYELVAEDKNFKWGKDQDYSDQGIIDMREKITEYWANNKYVKEIKE